VTALKRAGVKEHLTLHDLRHTAASLMVRAGANVKAVQRQLGHKSAAMTLDTYADLFDDDLDSLSDSMSQMLLRENVGRMWANEVGEAS
jgi:integrase